MKKFYIAALLGGVAIVAVGYAWAQGIVNLASPTGTERITVQPLQPSGAPGAIPAETDINGIRNTTGVVTNPLVGAGTVNATRVNSSYVFTGAATAVTFNLPSPAPDGFIVEVINGTTSAFAGTITVTPGAGQTLVPVSGAITNLASGASREWRFSLGTNVWYGVR